MTAERIDWLDELGPVPSSFWQKSVFTWMKNQIMSHELLHFSTYHTSVPHSIRVLYQVVSSLTLFHVYLQSAHDTCSKCFLEIKWKQSFCGTFCILFESCDQYYWVFVITRCLVDRWFRSHCVIKWLGLSNKGLLVVCFIQTWPRLILGFIFQNEIVGNKSKNGIF